MIKEDLFQNLAVLIALSTEGTSYNATEKDICNLLLCPRTAVTAKPYLRPTGPNVNPCAPWYAWSPPLPSLSHQPSDSLIILVSFSSLIAQDVSHFQLSAASLSVGFSCLFLYDNLFSPLFRVLPKCLHLVFLLFGMGILPACICVQHKRAVPAEPRKEHQIPWDWIYRQF